MPYILVCVLGSIEGTQPEFRTVNCVYIHPEHPSYHGHVPNKSYCSTQSGGTFFYLMF